MAVDLSMSVLVVDDYNTMIRIIRNLLKQLGFENIDDASDGSAALNKMRGKKYGLVISDWNMEPMTGYDLLKEVRADPNLATTPFIMITAESKTENVIAAKNAGEIRAHGITDREHLAQLGGVSAPLGGKRHRALIDRPVRLAVEHHLAAELAIEFGDCAGAIDQPVAALYHDVGIGADQRQLV